METGTVPGIQELYVGLPGSSGLIWGGEEEECLTKVEDTLHSQAKSADAFCLRPFGSHPGPSDRFRIRLHKRAVIQNDQAGASEKRMLRLFPAFVQAEVQLRGLSIVRVLEQLFQNRTFAVLIAEDALQIGYECQWGRNKAGQGNTTRRK